MKQGKTILLVDSIINLFLGIILLSYSESIVDFFGLPLTDIYFYPNILGAILFGIGIALLIEYKRKDNLVGLGLGGAISINISGGIVLFLWLVLGNLNIPIQILIGISSLELLIYLKK